MTADNDKVMRVNKEGNIVKYLYTGYYVRGLHVQGSHLFVTNGLSGSIVKMQLEDGHILKVYDTKSTQLRNFASHFTDLCDIDLDILPLVQMRPGNVYTYNISSQTKKHRVGGLQFPFSVSPACVDGNLTYVICCKNTHEVRVYNDNWSLISSFGGFGSLNGQLNLPLSAVMTDHGFIYVADTDNNRVSMFTSDGQFVKHIIIYDVPYYEMKDRPLSLSVRGNYLFVSTENGRLTRYILY